MFQYQHVIEVILHTSVDQVNLNEIKKQKSKFLVIFLFTLCV
jgi:hypothetical protein